MPAAGLYLVRLVDEDTRIITAGEPDYLRQVRHVAFHREDAVDYDQPALVGLEACEHLLQIGHVVVAESGCARERRQTAVQYRSVNVAVGDDNVAFLCDSRQSAQVRLKARAENQCGLAVHEAGETTRPLEPNMVITVEPGIYLPGWGGVRIEDQCVMEGGRLRVLSTAPKLDLVKGA